MDEMSACEPVTVEQSRVSAARAQCYGFLAWFFLETPDTLFVERMLSREVSSYLDSLAGEASHVVIAGLEEMRGWLSAHAGASVDELRQELAVQEAWLFKGIAPGYGPPPPYEAVHRRPGTSVETETLLSLHAFYREAGAELSYASRERLDHLGVELDLMRFLCGEESRLWSAGAFTQAVRYRGIQRRLVNQHLLPWVPGYCERIRAEARAPFFHAVANMLSGFLAEDAGLLERQATNDRRDEDA